MVILKNVTKKDKYIECDYYPEGKDSSGHIIYDFKDDKIIEKKLSPRYDEIEIYFNYALKRLQRIIKSDDFKNGEFKEEYAALWYWST